MGSTSDPGATPGLTCLTHGNSATMGEGHGTPIWK